MNATDTKRQIDLSGVQLVFLIISMAWLAIVIPLMIAIIGMPDAIAGTQNALTLLLATLAFAGAVASWFFRRAGVYVYIAASAGLLAKGMWYWTQGTADFPFAFLILLMVYVGAVVTCWAKFEA